MAVYTQVSADQLNVFLKAYSLGDVSSFKGIDGGIENTNYFLDTCSVNPKQSPANRRWVLTLFENLAPESLPFYIALTRTLACEGLAVPAPLQRNDGRYMGVLLGKPAMVVPRFPGKPVSRPTSAQCESVGKWMARFHLLGLQSALQLDQPRHLVWFDYHYAQLLPFLSRSDRQLYSTLLDELKNAQPVLARLPSAVIHGDLFKDNVLFNGECISGVIDFYNAATDHLLLDLAIAVNDWAVTEAGYDQASYNAMISGYQSVRKMTEEEVQCWPLLLKKAAMSFWISRLASHHQEGYQKQAVDGDQTKDPEEMKVIMGFSPLEITH